MPIGHDWSQRAPCQPAVQVQDPSAGLHFAPLAQWQVALQPGPQVPSEQGAEQSSPRQPSLQKHVPSIGEQSTKFSQEHSREQFLP